MKIAKQNNPANFDSLYDTGTEPAEKKDRRIHYAVEDNYDFSGNDAADVTGIQALHVYGNQYADYIRATKEMAAIFDAKAGADEAAKWANCTADEKECLAKRHIITDKNLRLEVLTAAQDKQCFFIHAAQSIAARKARIQAAVLAIGYEISEAVDRADLYGEVFGKVEKYVSANDPDLKDWMKSVGPYVGGGLQAKTYYNATIDAIYTAIIENGEY